MIVHILINPTIINKAKFPEERLRNVVHWGYIIIICILQLNGYFLLNARPTWNKIWITSNEMNPLDTQVYTFCQKIVTITTRRQRYYRQVIAPSRPRCVHLKTQKWPEVENHKTFVELVNNCSLIKVLMNFPDLMLLFCTWRFNCLLKNFS